MFNKVIDKLPNDTNLKELVSGSKRFITSL